MQDALDRGETLENENRGFERQLDRESALNEAQSKEILELMEKCRRLSSELESVRNNNGILIAENSDLSDRLSNLIGSLNSALDTAEELRIESEREKNKSANLVEQLRQLEKAMSSATEALSIDLHNAEQRIEELSDELDSTRSEAESLRDLGSQDYNFRFRREKQLLYDLIDKIYAHIEYPTRNYRRE